MGCSLGNSKGTDPPGYSLSFFAVCPIVEDLVINRHCVDGAVLHYKHSSGQGLHTVVY